MKTKTSPIIALALAALLAAASLAEAGPQVTRGSQQPLAATASPTFVGETLTGLTASKPVFTDGSKALTSSGTVPINQGGTGQTDAAAAFGALKQAATEEASGVVPLATSAEVIAGTEDAKAVTPAGIKAALTNTGYDVGIGSTVAGKNLSVRATLGTELVTWTDAGWDEDGATWIFAGGVLTHVSGNTTAVTATLGSAPVSGTVYRVSITGTGGGGTATYTIGGAKGTTIAASGAIAIEDYITANSTASLVITPASGCTVAITSISVQALTDATGDLTVDGNLTVRTPGTATHKMINVDDGAGTVRDIRFMSGGVWRWFIRTNATAEAGSNAGSDFQFISRTDTGSNANTVMAFSRRYPRVGINNVEYPGNTLDVQGAMYLGANFTGGAPGVTAPIYGFAVDGGISIGTTSHNAEAKEPILLMGESATAPAGKTNAAGAFTMDNGGTAEFYALNESGNATQLSGHHITAGAGTGITVTQSGAVTRKVYTVTTTYAAYSDSDTKKGVVIATLPAKTKLVGAYADTTAAYTGGAVSAATLVVGVTAEDGAEIIASHDVFSSAVTKGLADADMGTAMTRAAQIQGGYLPSWTGTTAVYATINTASANTSALTAGSTTFYLVTERF